MLDLKVLNSFRSALASHVVVYQWGWYCTVSVHQ